MFSATVLHFTWVVSNYSAVQAITSCSRTWNMYHILFWNLKHVPNLHPIMRQIILPLAVFLRFIWMLPYLFVSIRFSIFYGYSNIYLLRSGKANKKKYFVNICKTFYYWNIYSYICIFSIMCIKHKCFSFTYTSLTTIKKTDNT